MATAPSGSKLLPPLHTVNTVVGNDIYRSMLACTMGMHMSQREFVEGAIRLRVAVEALRSEEASTVTILCDNPDFNGLPNAAVIVSGEWTDHIDRRYAGNTFIACLEQALVDKPR